METAQQKAAPGLPDLIRKVLGSPQSEQVIKQQILKIASENMHVPEITTALLEVLPLTKDKETKDRLLGFLAGLDTSRFTDVAALYTALLNAFKEEKDRSVRTWLLERLQNGLHQDERLASFFLELQGMELLSEPERIAVQGAIAALPSISEETAILALRRCVLAPAIIQSGAVDLAERCTSWGPALIDALQPYLDFNVQRDIRLRILSRLANARSLVPAYVPMLAHLLRTDPDAYTRQKALTALSRIRPWDGELMAQLIWSSTQDGDKNVRNAAITLQKDMPELSDEQLIMMAGLLATDRSVSIRITILDLLKPAMRVKEVCEAVARVLATNPGVYEDVEFDAMIGMLAPYAGREEAIRQKLLDSIAGLPRVAQRKKILQLIIPVVKIETVLASLLRIFRKERDVSLREVLFQQLKGLSITRHDELVDVFCEELTEPGSPFRTTCAGVLANASEQYPQIVKALEDVLLFDQDRELVRLCLDGYLKPGTDKRFDVLLAVVRNEVIDSQSRQRALDEIIKLPPDESQQEELTAVLSGLKPGTLKL